MCRGSICRANLNCTVNVMTHHPIEPSRHLSRHPSYPPITLLVTSRHKSPLIVKKTWESFLMKIYIKLRGLSPKEFRRHCKNSVMWGQNRLTACHPLSVTVSPFQPPRGRANKTLSRAILTSHLARSALEQTYLRIVL